MFSGNKFVAHIDINVIKVKIVGLIYERVGLIRQKYDNEILV